MKRLFVGLLMLPLAQGMAHAQGAASPAGDPAAGKAYWESDLTRCSRCHGDTAEGGFGPDLAGRGLNAAQVLRAARQPWGIMPAFVDSQLSGQQAADLAAYFATLPKPAQPGPWRVEVPAGAPPGQAMHINIGCGQCHGPTLNGPRGNLGALNADFDYFANLVYNHTTAMPQHRVLLGNQGTNLDMGNYNRARVTEGMLRQIYFWMRDEMGFRVPMQGRLSKGEMGPTGMTYTLTVRNNGVQGRGLIAEGLTVSLDIPQNAQVVAATGPGYQGVRMGETGSVAMWTLDRSAPRDQVTYTITLSQPGTANSNLRGAIRWTKPGPKTGPNTDVVNIAPAPLG